ncbi:MAG: hypothetical protein IKK10_06230 [Clostridia bacterium]|nr:hypothetical protein [Clostridia bacterium]
MKKSIKIIALCLTVAAFALLFTGCDYLDQMRANHAILSEDRETISFRGETYRKLPTHESIYVSSSYGYEYDNISVTDADVPVLLSETQRYSSEYDKAKDIFSINIWVAADNGSFTTEYISSSDNMLYYCNEKDYDKYVKALSSNELNCAGIEFEVVEADGWYYTLEVLSEDFTKEIFEHLSNPENMSENVYEELFIRNEYCDTLQSGIYKCDENALVAAYLNNITIARDSESKAYLVDYTTEKAVELSDKASKELKDEHFYGSWSDTAYDTEYVGVIGSADGPTMMFVD